MDLRLSGRGKKTDKIDPEEIEKEEVYEQLCDMPAPGDGRGKEEEKKDGDGLSQEQQETQVASASEVAHQLASQAQGRGRTENTLLDTPSQPRSQEADAQMWESA